MAKKSRSSATPDRPGGPAGAGAPGEPGSEAPTRFEPWAWVSFALGLLVAGAYLYLGLRPGGRGPILVFTVGIPVLGVLSALGMAVGMTWSVLRKPVLQRGRLKALITGGASVWICSLPIPYPSSHEGSPSPSTFQLPFEGPRTVRWGGNERTQNALIFDPSRRFGVVFEAPEDGSTEVHAPGEGILVAWRALRGDATRRVAVLEVAPDEYLFVEGLGAEEGPEIGARVDPGTRLGRQEGPLTVYLCDRAESGEGEGIPFRFRGYRVGETLREQGYPVRGEEVRPGSSDSGS